MSDERPTVSISAPSTGEQTPEETPRRGPLPIAQDTEDFLQTLVKQQCELLEAMAGIILLRPMRDQEISSIVKYVSNSNYSLTPQQYKRLADVATRAARENRPLVDTLAASQGLLSQEPDYHLLAAPLRLGGRPQGASVCVVPYDVSADRSDGLQRLELSGVRLESHLWKQQALNEAQSKIQLRETLDLVDRSFHGHTTQEMASIFANEIQRRFGCTRVSIGLVRMHSIRVVAVSGGEDVDRRSEFVEVVEAVMEECADQDTEIRYPQPEDIDPSERRVVRAHASLSEKYGPAAIASFPLRVESGLIGVVVMERRAEDPFTDASLHLLRLVAEYIGPTVWTRRLADRGILAVARDRTIELAEAAVGPQKTGAKILALLAILLLIASVAIPVRDRAVGQGRIVAEVRRQVSAPFQGQIKSVKVKPGDLVDKGDLLLQLDTTRTLFQLTQKRNEIAKLSTQADEERAKGHPEQAMILERQIDMTRAELGTTQYQVDQADVRAPISGMITQGRLENIEGEVVSPEKPLLEIADPSSIGAIVLVPEEAVSRIEIGQRGQIALAADPSRRIQFAVTQITPAAEVFQQQNVYRVQVRLEDAPGWLRPGMEGRAKVYGKRSNLLMIYGRPLFDTARMWLWW